MALKNRMITLLITICIYSGVGMSNTQADTDSNHPLQGQILINEVMASNGSSLEDADGDFPDWIELYNPSDHPVCLEGYHLSDHDVHLTKWTFPAITIEPMSYLLVFASNKDNVDADGVLHTNFAISREGEPITLTAPNGITVVDRIEPIHIPRDISYGRLPDGSDTFVFFDSPTPGRANQHTHTRIGVLDAPSFSHEGGFFPHSFSLVLSASDDDVSIYYTTDGSRPDAQATRYEHPILITDLKGTPDRWSVIPTNPGAGEAWGSWRPPVQESAKAVTIRAVAKRDGYISSTVESHTFFVGNMWEDRYRIPVISILFDPASFFDDQIGIYVPGDHFREDSPRYSGNYFQRGHAFECAVHIEYFDALSDRVLAQDAGVRIHGSGSRRNPIKTLRLYARADYGTSTFDHAFFHEKPIDSFKRLLLRNSGNDFESTHFRDALAHTLITHTSIDYQAYRPVIVFLNGEYWGIHNMRERIDRFYIENNHGVHSQSIDLLANHELVQGERTHYDEMLAFALNSGLPDHAHYQKMSTLMDMDNFIDYQIAQIYFANTDWPVQNIRFFRPQTDDGRWRWILYDTDFGFGFLGFGDWERDTAYTHDTFSHAAGFGEPNIGNSKGTELFAALLQNPTFRYRFTNIFANHLNTTFASERVLEEIDRLTDLLAPHMGEHIARWTYPAPDMATWYDNIETLRRFAKNRADVLFEQLAHHFALSETALITLSVCSPQHGHIRINDMPLDGSVPMTSYDMEAWQGRYFQNVPVVLTAVPSQGYRFVRWNIEGEQVYTSDNEPSPEAMFNNWCAEYAHELTISIMPGDQLTVQANFAKAVDH